MFTPERLAAGLDVVGHFSILADDAPFQVDFRGATIEVVLPDLRTALNLRKKFSRNDRRAWTNSVRSMMALTGLELRVWVRGRQLGRLAATSKQSLLAVSLGVDPLELRLAAILAILLGRQP
jgi:hypothetical protein